MTSPLPSSPPAVDFYTQALKSLSEWCPNDSKDFGSKSTNLPIRIARELTKISDTKKKHKKSSSLGHGEQVSGSTTLGNAESSKSEEKTSSLWEKMEIYFRAVQECDIESLLRKGLDKSLFSFPFLEREDVEFQENASLNGNGAVQEKKSEPMELDSVHPNLVLAPEVVADHMKEVRAINEEKEEEQEASECAYSSWVLHSQKRTNFTQRPKKKRKQYGNEAGLKMLLKLPHMEKADSVFCDVCYMQIENVKSNKVVSCNTCHITVHKKCYGLNETEEQPWGCYQCNNLEGKGSCMLCPKSVGALKPVSGNYKFEKEKKYAHLFCCMWNPETYIKDIETMEPVMKVGVVPDVKKNYVCNACEVNSGICVRCSIGTCRTTFHAICAREARYRMEIWQKVGCAEVELRAYCSKHSTPREVPVPLPSKPSKLKIKHKGKDIIQDSIKQTGFKEKTKVDTSLESLKNADMPSNVNSNVKVRENGQTTDTPNFISVLNKATKDSRYTHTSPSFNPDQVQSSEMNGQRELSEARYQSEYIRENACFDEIAEEKDRINGTSRSCIHPIIQKKMLQLPQVIFAKEGRELNSNGQREGVTISDNKGGSCSQNSSPSYNDLSHKLDSKRMDQLTKAREMGILKSSPKDEIEGEIIYLQNKLLDTAISIHHGSEDLLVKVAKKLPQELYALKKRQWDLVSVNNYLNEVKEEKKQERKERKHREAQVVLATATAAAATSSRLLRKDGNHDINHPDSENPQISNGHCGPPKRVSLLVSVGPRLKETSRSSIIKTSPDKQTEGNTLCCDICRQPETLLNRLFICSSCKVAVHVHCYQKIIDPPVGPWKCELCDDISQYERPINQGLIGTKCGLCGLESSGAFRKTTSGQWVHAFCAEWLLESTFKRGQTELIDGMGSLPKEKGLFKCSVCDQNTGFCIKCSYGHCQAAFHPTCAKEAHFYMSINGISGNVHHKGYCEKHSADQKSKADNEQCGSEELKSIKHLRFELEKLRILCERIVRREKIKKEIVVCSQEIFAYRKQCLVRSVLHVKGSSFLSGVSSESATTSFDNRSYSGMIHRSDDVTVDSTVSGKRCKKSYIDDGSTSHLIFNRRISNISSCSGKKLPIRAQTLSVRNSNSEGENIKLKKPVENFHKEVVMTSHQASVQNRRLPKGFVYVPVDSLSMEKSVHDSKSREPEEPGG